MGRSLVRLESHQDLHLDLAIYMFIDFSSEPQKHQTQQKLSAFVVYWKVLEASWSNSVDPDQTAPVGSGSTHFASLLT